MGAAKLKKNANFEHEWNSHKKCGTVYCFCDSFFVAVGAELLRSVARKESVRRNLREGCHVCVTMCIVVRSVL